MSVDTQQPLDALAAGQLWRTENGYILITGRCSRIVSYKKLREPRQLATVTNIIRPEALMAYLSDVRGELVPDSCVNLSGEPIT